MQAISVTMETAASSGTEFVSVPLMLIKDESNDDAEMADTNFVLNNSSIMAEPDPMNLLDPMTLPPREEEEPHICDGPDSETGSDLSGLGPTRETWQSWMVEFPWLLHEDNDEYFAYCLYCNNKISFKHTKHPRYHGMAKNHRENEENYLAFKESEGRANLNSSAENIKQEFGTDTNVSAIKFKRMSQTELLFNFNWTRWQKRHPWLERDKNDMKYGFCKYCELRINVEYSYIRERHEEGLKHKNAVREHLRKEAVEEANEDGNENEEATGEAADERNENDSRSKRNENAATSGQSNKDSEEQEATKNHRSLKRKRKRLEYRLTSPWFEMYDELNARCTLCDSIMIANNFTRHLRSQMHYQSEKLLKNTNNKKKSTVMKVKEECFSNSRKWKNLSRKHPWLIEDPQDPIYGYCKYCKKRLHKAMLSMRRVIHERSVRHKNAELMYKESLYKVKKQVKGKPSSDAEEESEEQEETQMYDNEYNDSENNDGSQPAETEAEEDDNEENEDDAASNNDAEENSNDEEEDNDDADADKSKTPRMVRGSDEWIKAYPWCQKYPKDKNFVFCTYCNIKLKLKFSRIQHQKSARHKEGHKNVMKMFAKTQLENAQTNGKSRFYEWLVHSKSNPHHVFCKYCRIRLTNNASKTKHEYSNRHKESAKQFLANENKKKVEQQKVAAAATTPATQQPTTYKRSMKTKVIMWKSKFPWLTYKLSELQENYGYCRLCEARVFMPTEKYVSKHQRTSKHLRRKLAMKRQHLEKQMAEKAAAAAENVQQLETAEAEHVKKSNSLGLDWIELSKRHAWLLPDTQQPLQYGHCKYCKTRLNIKGHLIIRHETSLKHNTAEAEFNKNNTIEENQNSSEDAVVLDDDESNDLASVKSEPMDKDEVLEYLLQRSENTKTSNNNLDDMEVTDPLPPPPPPLHKRSRTSDHCLVDRARRLTKAHLELLRLSRDLSEGSRSHKNRGRISLPSSLFNTSAALAALLTPTQATPQPPSPSSVASTPTLPTRNNYELFFDSVCESVKTLPSDLAAEGKIKIMQLVADLEIRALQRSSHSIEYARNLQQITAIATPVSSRSSTSPVVSNDVLPSTTTNGLDNDVAVLTPSTTPGPTTTVSTHSLDPSLRIIPLSSTSRHSDSSLSLDNSIRRIQLSKINTTPDNSFKRVLVNPLAQTLSKHNDICISRMPQRSPVKVNLSSSSPQTQYQRLNTQQHSAPSSNNVGGPTERMQAPLNNSTLIDNGFRRIQLSSKSQSQSAAGTEMGFRRIHLQGNGASSKAPATTYTISNWKDA